MFLSGSSTRPDFVRRGSEERGGRDELEPVVEDGCWDELCPPGTTTGGGDTPTGEGLAGMESKYYMHNFCLSLVDWYT